MASQEHIDCMPLRRVTDGPLFGSGAGVVSDLTNMRLRPGGYAEARGGFDKLKPSGGTPTDALTGGGFAQICQVATSYGWIRTFDAAAGVGSQYSANRQFNPGYWLPFPTGAVNDAVYFGSDMPFSRIAVLPYPAANWTVTIVYEYWNGAAWSALTTAETINWLPGTPTIQFASWTMPSNWATTTVGDAGTGNILKYWMRIRISVSTAIVTLARVSYARGQWYGMREIYEASQNPLSSGITGTLKRYGQSGTTAEWFSVNSALFSASTSPTRMCSYRGRLMLVNGKETKKWDGHSFADLGLAKPGAGATAAPQAGAGYGAAIRRVYIAFGYGPSEDVLGDIAHPFDWKPLYGVSEATYLGEVTTTGPNGFIRVDWSLLTIGADVSTIHFYVTDDLTNVPAPKRAKWPAFLHDTFTRYEFQLTTVEDIGGITTADLSPPQEAILYDNKPPGRCNYSLVYQNRLFLGDYDYWYWSDPFKPDIFQKAFNYIPLARAWGGRHMGGIEFADQAVLFTEDQTWGLTNVDLDVPQLYPIALGVGCVAPDAIAVGDGWLVWLARDGVYAWDGSPKGPKNVSYEDMDTTFGQMAFETHGGSMAAICDGQYVVRLAAAGRDLGAGAGLCWRLNLENMKWSRITPTGFASTLYPLETIHAPLGNADAGVPHIIWGKADYGTGETDYSLYLGELTTQDNGTNYTCSATMHFPLPANRLVKPNRLLCYYQAANGWGTPTILDASTAKIGSDTGTWNTGTPDAGDDYTIIAGTPSGQSAGSSDLQFTFSVSSAASGTVNAQRFFGAVLEGMRAGIRRGAV